MRLMLTSAGFDTVRLEEEFRRLVGKDVGEVRALFVPTAAVDEEAKAVLPKCWQDLIKVGVKEAYIDTYDLDREMSEDEACGYDVIYFCGGDTQYLMDRILEVGFDRRILEALRNGTLYVGVSAGSLILTHDLNNGLKLVDCRMHVHCEEGNPAGKVALGGDERIDLTNSQALVIQNDEAYIFE